MSLYFVTAPSSSEGELKSLAESFGGITWQGPSVANTSALFSAPLTIDQLEIMIPHSSMIVPVSPLQLPAGADIPSRVWDWLEASITRKST